MALPLQTTILLRAARQLLDGAEDRYDLALTLTDLATVYRQRGKTSHAALAQQQALARNKKMRGIWSATAASWLAHCRRVT